MEKQEVVVLGGGISGLSAAYTLIKNGVNCAVYERENKPGGLCRSFTVEGYTFDTFAHVSFSTDPYIRSLMEEQTEHWTYSPEALNYYQGSWVRNPAQNNLVDLPVEERIRVIEGFVNRQKREIHNYDDWLRVQYGDYFTDHFPAKYTRKYWTVEPSELETKWVCGRMYEPTLQEVLRGAMTKETPNVHYSKEIHYPKSGGYEAFLHTLCETVPVHCNKTVCKVDTDKKVLQFTDGTAVEYGQLISTIPLTELIGCMEKVPKEIMDAREELDYTSGVLVSVGAVRGRENLPLWFYIYDEELAPARVYVSSNMASDNAPAGGVAIQAEIYFSKRKPLKKSMEELKRDTLQQLEQLGVIEVKDVSVCDVRTIQYGNVMFTPGIYEARDRIHQYLEQRNIRWAGRFGEWGYLWTGQSIDSGRQAAGKVMADREEGRK